MEVDSADISVALSNMRRRNWIPHFLPGCGSLLRYHAHVATMFDRVESWSQCIPACNLASWHSVVSLAPAVNNPVHLPKPSLLVTNRKMRFFGPLHLYVHHMFISLVGVVFFRCCCCRYLRATSAYLNARVTHNSSYFECVCFGTRRWQDTSKSYATGHICYLCRNWIDPAGNEMGGVLWRQMKVFFAPLLFGFFLSFSHSPTRRRPFGPADGTHIDTCPVFLATDRRHVALKFAVRFW